MNENAKSIRALLGTISIGVLSYIILYCINIILVKMLGVQAYGNYSSTIAAIYMLSVISLIGIDSGLNKFLPSYLNTEHFETIAGYMRYSHKQFLAVAVAFIVIGVGTVALLYQLDAHHIVSLHTLHPLYFFIWAVPFVGMLAFGAKLIRSTGHPHAALLANKTTQPFFILVILGAFLLSKHSFTVYHALFIFVGATILTIMCNITFVYFKTPIHKLVTIKAEFKVEKWLLINIKLVVLNFCMNNMALILIVITEIFKSETHDTGLITTVFLMTTVMWLLSGAVVAIFQPKINNAMQQHDYATARSSIWSSVLANAILNGLFLIVVYFYGEAWLGTFGIIFKQAYPFLLMISFTYFILLLLNPFLYFVQYTEKLHLMSTAAIIVFVIFIVGSSLCTYFYSTSGAVISYSLCVLFLPIYAVILCIKHWPFIFKLSSHS